MGGLGFMNRGLGFKGLGFRGLGHLPIAVVKAPNGSFLKFRAFLGGYLF